MAKMLQLVRPDFLRRAGWFVPLVFLSLAAAPGWQPVAQGREAGPDALGPEDRHTLRQYARDTWRSFEVMAAPKRLPADGLRRGADGVWSPTRKTSPTDIAAYLWSTLAAAKLQIIDWPEADRRFETTLSALAGIPRVHGFLLDQIDTVSGDPPREPATSGRAAHRKLSAVDNAWLATALMMLANTRPALRDRARTLLEPFDFRFFYVPYDPADPSTRPGQLHGAYWTDTSKYGDLLGLVNTETRIVSYIGIARGQLPREHYYHIFRTLPGEKVPQTQRPQGEPRTFLGVTVFEGHYTYHNMRIVPSWGGSMFEALMVPLFVPEGRWAPRSWGVNHPLYVRAQIEHGLEERRYGFWGFSPACRPEGGYRTYGVNALGVNPMGYHTHDLADSEKVSSAAWEPVITPHASFLALSYAPRKALANLKKLRARFPIYGPCGFHDSVNLSSGKVSNCILALDQGMILAAIANVLADDAMQHALADGPFEGAIRALIAPEAFTAGAP